MEMPLIFYEVHSNLPREGPGDNQSTAKAFQILRKVPATPRILDIGCGPGIHTIELANHLQNTLIQSDDIIFLE